MYRTVRCKNCGHNVGINYGVTVSDHADHQDLFDLKEGEFIKNKTIDVNGNPVFLVYKILDGSYNPTLFNDRGEIIDV